MAATDRAQVLAYADAHGAKQAADRFGISAGTIRSWRSRARKRAARPADPLGVRPESPAGQFDAQARSIVAWAQAGTCLRCGGAGYLAVNTPAARARTPALAGLRHAKRITCPDCGDPAHRQVVVGANLRLAMQAAQADRLAVATDEHRHSPEARVWRE